MADTKITALTAISTVDPAVDVLPIVDVSDTTMAASGTTKKITSNQILGAGGTATLASATISGDLTVDTSTLKVDSANNRVGILTATPTAPLDILGNGLADALLIRGNDNANCKIRMVNSGASGEEFSLSVGYPGASNSSFVLRSITAGINRYVADQTGAHTWATNAGTAMTLNSTGLGVGVSPSAKLDVYQATLGTAYFRGGYSARQLTLTATSDGSNDGAIHTFSIGSSAGQFLFANSGGTRLTIDSSGNVGVGVTPSYKFHALVASGYSGAFKASTAAITGLLIGNTVADLIAGVDASGNGRVTADTSKYLGLGSNGINDRATLDSAGNFVVGIAAVATTATDGFLYVTGCAGTPTGTPTAKTGRVPIVVDTTNNKLYFYSGGSWVAAN